MKQLSCDGWPAGLVLHPAALKGRARAALLEDVTAALRRAPFFTPTMPRWGRPFSVRMSNFGPLGWVSDKSGYRYQDVHPETKAPWPPMPEGLLRLWDEFTGWPAPPQAALINHYRPGARMGLHIDRDEEDMRAPILSISLGCDALFRIGGPSRSGPTVSLRLRDGDILLMAGDSRRCYHGIDRIYPATGRLPDAMGEGRINITLRRVTLA